MTRTRKWLLTVVVVALAALVAVMVPGSPARDFVSGVRHSECTTWFGHDEGRTLTAYGDSVTEADSFPQYGLLGERSWYSHLICPGTFADGGNAGATGETSAQVTARLIADAPAADVLVLAAGTNDLRTGVPTDQTIEHLGRALDAAARDADEVLVATVPPWPDTDAGPLNAAIRALAAERGVPVADFASVLSADGATIDGVHPTAASAERMAGLVAAASRS